MAIKDTDKANFIKRKIKQRLLFSLVALVLYFSFVLNWTNFGAGLRETIGDSHITGSLVMFVMLIVVFILSELLFIYLANNQKK